VFTVVEGKCRAIINKDGFTVFLGVFLYQYGAGVSRWDRKEQWDIRKRDMLNNQRM